MIDALHGQDDGRDAVDDAHDLDAAQQRDQPFGKAVAHEFLGQAVTPSVVNETIRTMCSMRWDSVNRS